MKQSTMKKTQSVLAITIAVFIGLSLLMPLTSFANDETPAPVVAGGSLYIKNYVVQKDGVNVQRVAPGEKCSIIISVRDTRFTAVPKIDEKTKNIVDFRVTSTASFQSPTYGDLIQKTPVVVMEAEKPIAIDYALTFHDITYLGGSNAFSFDVAYYEGNVAMQNLSLNISECQTASAESGAKPSIMVKSTAYGGQPVQAGDEFTFTITSFNTSKTTKLSDIVTSVSLPTGIALASGSNTTLTTSLAANGAYTTTFNLKALASAETGAANINVSYSYYIDGTSDMLTSGQTITVPVVQPDRFSFTSFDLPSEIFAGEESYFSVGFVNKGKGVLYNLTGEITGNFDNAGQTVYSGNLNSGTESSLDFSILSSATGTVTGTITITYEDSNGTEKKQTKEFSVTVAEMPQMNFPEMPKDPGMMPEEPQPQGGMPLWAMITIPAVLVLAAIAVWIVLKKRKAKKLAKQRLEDEDDEDF